MGRAAAGTAGTVGRTAAASARAAPAADASTGPAAVSASAIDPERARAAARHILNGRKYKGSPVPRPLHGLLRWIGDRISPIGRWIGDRFSWLPHWAVPYVQGLAVLVAAALVVFIVVRTVQAKARANPAGSGTPLPAAARAEDPDALEAAAAEAEARGDFALAVRLRFRAGLLRLDRDAHAIAYRASIPTGEVREQLHSPAFEGLADRFEDITYGGDAAGSADTDGARREWPTVVKSARRS